ncbi:MAG: DDE-type integrase/transposase/recombinase [Candidatus Pacebacteria bacterium]|nr:DDE-type integrase/transposase/recombinase [Candidatus Paceibacterota bacterium]
MITEKALYRMKVLVFWEKYGLKPTIEAFNVKRRTLFNWKRTLIKGKGKIEALNPKKTIPKTKRRRIWPLEIRTKIRLIREEHPNLGAEKIFPLLKEYCKKNNLKYPKARTIARIISDDKEKMRTFPQKISHSGKVKPIKRQKVLRKPKDIKPNHPGHLVALDTITKIINGKRRYIITFEDIYTRFSFAWSTKSHASKAAEEFFNLCIKVFPYSFNFLYVLTDNGSEFKKHFNQRLMELHLIHYHTYPRTPKMNAHVERFNRTIQDEFIDYNMHYLLNPDEFNRKLIDYLIFYNIDRVHGAFKNKLSPVQYMIEWQKEQIAKNITIVKSNNKSLIGPQECKTGWHYTMH